MLKPILFITVKSRYYMTTVTSSILLRAIMHPLESSLQSVSADKFQISYKFHSVTSCLGSFLLVENLLWNITTRLPRTSAKPLHAKMMHQGSFSKRGGGNAL